MAVNMGIKDLLLRSRRSTIKVGETMYFERVLI
jgi:hypothetical protein